MAYNRFILHKEGKDEVLLDLSQYPDMIPGNFLKGHKYINYLGEEVEGTYEVRMYAGEVEVTDNE